MISSILRLVTDRVSPEDSALELAAGCNRILYVAAGSATVAAGAVVASLSANSAWWGRGAARIRAGAQGARLLRFELIVGAPAAPEAAGEGVDSRLSLSMPLILAAEEPKLLRCDRVDFPPGGIAYTHVHQGPGLRCLQDGTIRIETAGTVHDYAPGEAWFESGPDPVLAIASTTAPTYFIRVMVLPRTLLGRSSIRYIRPEDQDKPKLQSYQGLIDAPIEL